MRTIRVNVTKRDIEEGRPRAAGQCPIAMAIRRATRGSFVSVGTFTAHVNSLGAKLSSPVSKFVSEFDAGKPVKPFRFTLTLR